MAGRWVTTLRCVALCLALSCHSSHSPGIHYHLRTCVTVFATRLTGPPSFSASIHITRDSHSHTRAYTHPASHTQSQPHRIPRQTAPKGSTLSPPSAQHHRLLTAAIYRSQAWARGTAASANACTGWVMLYACVQHKSSVRSTCGNVRGMQRLWVANYVWNNY